MANQADSLRMTLRRLFGLLVANCLITACATGPNPVEQRKDYWKGVIAIEIPVGTSEDSIKSWAKTRSIKLAFNPDTHELVGSLETIPVDNLVCKDFYLDLHISLDWDGKSKHEEVTSFGNCL